MLVDTNLLVRTLQPNHALYGLAERALRLLPEQGFEIHVVPQNLVELWTFATRPLGENGLGMTSEEASVELQRIKRVFLFLPETQDVYPPWERLVRQHQVMGKPSHDARLVAAMMVHNIRTIVTFDKTGFPRFPGIRVIHPNEVQA